MNIDAIDAQISKLRQEAAESQRKLSQLVKKKKFAMERSPSPPPRQSGCHDLEDTITSGDEDETHSSVFNNFVKTEAASPTTIACTATFPQRSEVGLKKTVESYASPNFARGQPKQTQETFANRMKEAKELRLAQKKEKGDYLSGRVAQFEDLPRMEEVRGDTKDIYSKQILKSRFYTAEEIDKQFQDKKVLTIKGVYETIQPPEYEEPKFSNWVVLGILVNKSSVYKNRGGKKSFTATLSDFKFTIPITFHGPACERYYKVAEGAVIAVLNPDIYKTKEVGGNGELYNCFGLSYKASVDGVLELGFAKNFDYCESITAKGVRCKNHVDKSQNVVCEYHQQLALDRNRSKRQELNSTNTRYYEPKSRNGTKLQSYGFDAGKKIGLVAAQRAGSMYDYGSHSRVYSGGSNIKGEIKQGDFAQQARNRITKTVTAKRFGKDIEMRQKLTKAMTQMFDETHKRKADPNSGYKFPQGTVNKIGFDPRNLRADLPQIDRTRLQRNANEVNLRKVKCVEKHDDDDSDDDLEIV